jgi:hypothetical protein
MSDQSSPPVITQPIQSTLTAQIGALFSTPVLTALRYALTALGPLFAAAGLTVLTPDQVNHIIGLVQQVGVAVAALLAFVGIVGPIVVSVIGTFKSTQKQQVASVQAMPGVSRVTVNAKATPGLAEMVADPANPKVQAEPGQERKVAELATQA